MILLNDWIADLGLAEGMADPEIPEVRAELQREDASPGAQKSLGSTGWLLLAFGLILAVVAVIVLALG